MGEERGLLFIGDPHLASRPPGFRKDDYPNVILAKLTWVLEYARENALRPVILGDLFDFPRDNATWMLVRLLDLLKGALAIYGNHDCKENALGENDTLSVLCAAGAIKLLDQTGPWSGVIGGRPVIVGGTSWGRKMPGSWGEEDKGIAKDEGGRMKDEGENRSGKREVSSEKEDTGNWQLTTGNSAHSAIGDRQSAMTQHSALNTQHSRPLVFWVTHHDLRFPGYEESARQDCREIPGIDVVVNGHIHRNLGEVRAGRTLWINPGNIARVARSDASRQHVPSVLRIDIDADGFRTERVEVPCRPFDEVFFEDVAGAEVSFDESAFVRELAALEAAKTAGGAGLMQFLEANLPQFGDDVAKEIMSLAREVLEHGD